jgi:ABC-type uncharacterized transport system substrate-binding protein
MPIATPLRRAARGAAVAAALLAFAGCASLRSPPPAPQPENVPVAEATPPPVVVAPAPAPPPPKAPAPKPPPPAPRNVVVLFEQGTAGYEDVAAEIAAELPRDRYHTLLVPIPATAAAPADLLNPLVALKPSIAVAVGREAVELARTHLSATPLVFCQVFNYQEFLEDGRRIWGVSPMPPLALPLRGWTSVNPLRRRIGLIVSDAHSTLIDEAVAAAGDAFEIKHAVSSSDRETLYLFKRLAADVDGFWLVPDNQILSPSVLRELLDYAVTHDVGVLVFNESLLSWGALMSAATTSTDVARGVRAVLDRVAAGATKDLPQLTPLAETRLTVNNDVAGRLGVTGAPQAPWVVRDAD